MKAPITICWLHRDLRLWDNTALLHALRDNGQVLCIFIFDKKILDDLQKKDRRITFIWQQLQQIKQTLEDFGSSLLCLHDMPDKAFNTLLTQFDVKAVYKNEDYEPYEVRRDREIVSILRNRGITYHSFKDHVIFHKNEIVKPDGKPYTIFTPYSKKWLMSLTPALLKAADVFMLRERFYSCRPFPFPSLESLGFCYSAPVTPPADINIPILENYAANRDYPASEHGTSRLGIHLRYGTISIRSLVQAALNHSDAFLKELIWREFFQMILWHFPQTGSGSCFHPEYENIRWQNNETEFERWKAGTTGFPLVDAGMRELMATGFMHNRVRMLTASFLCKHLLIDWRWGEAYFAEQLLDYDMASNNGNWQWAAGCGCDAAPYFRIFNPALQQQKFDADFLYIKKWIPEFGTQEYPLPITDHKEARLRCLRVYKAALQE